MSDPDPAVGHRAVIDRAWTRSRMCGLDQASPLDLPFDASFDVDSAFARAARPVLDYLGGLLPGCGTAAVLLDAQGRLLVRVCDDPSLSRRMNDGNSLPGYLWSEEFAGANAVGIALEERVPTWTSGQDHYLEALRDLACAAVPVVNPLTQRVVGVLDLTAQLSSASPLMLPMALQAARTIEQRLVDAGTVTERALLGRFLTATRRPGKAVLAVSDRTELSNYAAGEGEDKRQRVVGHFINAVVGNIANRNALLRRRVEVHVVHADAVTHDDPAFLHRLDHGRFDGRKLRDDAVRIGDQLD